jgi:putative spermidine/putrescine transport system permease protein
MAGVQAAVTERLRVAAPRRFPWVQVLIVPTLLFLLVFFAVPYLNMVRMSFLLKPAEGPYLPQFTLANYARALLDPFNWKILRNTFWYSILTTVITLVLGYPIAYHLTQATPRRKRWLLVLIISPLLVSVVVRGFAWLILLGRVGLVNQFMQWAAGTELILIGTPDGIVVGLVHVFIPFMALSIAGSLQNISPDVVQAARSLGAGPWQRFWRVIWPLSLPGVLAGSVLVFVLAVSSYVIPIMLGASNVLVMPMLIVQTLLDTFNWPLGSALSMIFFGLTATILALYLKLMGRSMRWTAP